MKTSTLLIGSALLLGTGAGVYLLTKPKKHPEEDKYGNKRLEDGGVTTTKTGAATTLTEPDWNNPFDMQYAEDVRSWITPKKPLILPLSKATALAEALKKARGACWVCDDDEEAVHQIFSKQLKSKMDVALLSKAFWGSYKTDLWQHLAAFLDVDEMETYVHAPVRKLPKYIV